MPICSYLVFPRTDPASLADRLRRLPGCTVSAADNADLLILVTDTPDDAAEADLQERLAAEPDIQCQVLTFGDIAPDAGPQAHRRKRRRDAVEEEA